MKQEETKKNLQPPAEFFGLTDIEAEKRLLQYGENTIIKKKKSKSFFILLKKFKSPLILLLMSASVVSIFLGEHTDAVIILVMVILSAILDFINTQRSENAVEDLIAKVSVTAKVIRNGREKEVSIKEIVPGDVIQLTAGNVIPADCLVMDAKDLFVNQSALTGESFPVEKRASDDIKNASEINPENANQVLMGSSVITGFAAVKVINTGGNTHYGKIAEKLSGAVQENDFERGIKQFSYLILQVTFVLVALVFLINALVPGRGVFESFIFALAVAIGLTPELLPVVISISLSRGSLRMSKKDVIVKNLSSIQNFGSMNILCTDKTGTLTEDKIALVKYVDGFGTVSDNVLMHSYLNSIFHTGVKNPLDNAIREFRHLDVTGYEKIDEIPFDFTRRRESIIVEKDGKRKMITKGAPENIYGICASYHKEGSLHEFNKLIEKSVNPEFESLSGKGFRVLAVAMKELDHRQEIYEKDEEKNMTFLGFIAFYDPPKQSAAESIKELEKLGIEIKILTGDNELLTAKICEDIGLQVKGVVVGSQINDLSEQQLQKLSLKTTIFARITPSQKERIIINLKKAGNSVGYLGDGINDAPALKVADVGISVNNAVDVAKDTASIILLKKSLSVLKEGVVEGRRTFQNTMKYIMMGISSNFGNMFSMAGLSAVLPFFPMLPSQVLLNNLMYDLSQFALPSDKVDSQDIQKPLRWDMKFIRKYMFVFGPISSVFDFLTFAAMYYFFRPEVHQFQAAWFVESLATQTLVIYVIRTRKIPFLQSSPGKFVLISTLGVVLIGAALPYLPVVGKVLNFAPLSLKMMLSIAVLVFIYLLCAQIVKIYFYRRIQKKMLIDTA